MVLFLIFWLPLTVYTALNMYAAWLNPELYFRLLAWQRGKKTYAPVKVTQNEEL